MKLLGPARQPFARRGLSLVELVLGMTLMSMMLGSIGSILVSSSRAWHAGQVESLLERNAQRTLNQVARELAPIGAQQLVPQPLAPLGSSSMRYHKNQGFGPTGVVWSAPLRLEHRREAAELDNGLDDDGDGLVDEGELVWTRDDGLPTQQQVVWARGLCEYLEGELANGGDDNGNLLVDEPGLSFELVGSRLAIRLSMQAVDPDGVVLTHTAITSIGIRND